MMRTLRTSTVVLGSILAAVIEFCLGCLVCGLLKKLLKHFFVLGCGNFVRGLMVVTTRKNALVAHGQVQLSLCCRYS